MTDRMHGMVPAYCAACSPPVPAFERGDGSPVIRFHRDEPGFRTWLATHWGWYLNAPQGDGAASTPL